MIFTTYDEAKNKLASDLADGGFTADTNTEAFEQFCERWLTPVGGDRLDNSGWELVGDDEFDGGERFFQDALDNLEMEG